MEYVTHLNLQTIRILSKAWSDMANKKAGQQVAQEAGVKPTNEQLEGTEENAKKFAAFINSIK